MTATREPAVAAARAIWLAVRRDGLQPGPWGWTVPPPSAANLPEIGRLTVAVAAQVGENPSDEPVQLLLRLPDVPDEHAAVQYEPHVDRTPDGGLYRRVVGCCLTNAPGGTAVVGRRVLGRRAGDVYGWPGCVEHHGLLNLSVAPRLTAYWRWR